MKTKTFERKLRLSKSTIANLDETSMNMALGGATAACQTLNPDLCEETNNGPYYCPSVQPYSTCYPNCASVDPRCVWPKQTDITC